MKNSFQTLLLGAGFGAAFLIGQCFPRGAEAAPNGASPSPAGPAATGSLTLDAQGRGPVNPPPRPITPAEEVSGEGTAPIVYTENSSSSMSANGFLAVTGSYGVGTQVLYVIDTENRQLAVYEARGGSTEQRRIVMVGARRIDLDLQLPGYNDRSEYEYGDLEKLFAKRGKKDRSAKSGLERDNR